MGRVLVLGVGSPFGDDRLGWVAAEMLRQFPELNALMPDTVAISVIDRPGSLALAGWRDAQYVILIDAVRSGSLPGSLHRVAAPQIARGPSVSSSHGFGIADALALADVLGQDIGHIVLHGIEIAIPGSGEDLSAPVHLALPRLVQRVKGEILRWVRQPAAVSAD